MNLKQYSVIILCIVLSCNACRSSRSKFRYVQRHMHAMGIKYNLKITIDHVNLDSSIKNMQNYSMKTIKQQLKRAEYSMVLMPDSVRIIPNSSNINLKTGQLGSVDIDIKTRYILNKNKIRYIRKHHISVPGVYIIDKR